MKTTLTAEELAIVGLQIKDLAKVKPDRVRDMIEQNEQRAAQWSVASDDREKLFKKNEVLRRILEEVGC